MFPSREQCESDRIAEITASLNAQPCRVRKCVGEAKHESNPAVLSGMCGMSHEEEMYDTNGG